MDTNNNALLILLGSFLTFTGTWFVEYFKNKREKSEKEINFKLLAKQELKLVGKVLDKLKTTLEHKNYYDFNLRNRLSAIRYTLEGYRKDAIYLTTQDLQEKFIDLVSSIGDYHANIQSLQDLFWGEQNKLRAVKITNNLEGSPETGPAESIFKDENDLQRFFNENKLQYSIEHAEIKRQIDEITKDLEK